MDTQASVLFVSLCVGFCINCDTALVGSKTGMGGKADCHMT